MKHKKAILNAVFLFVMGLTTVHAQEAIITSGGNASGSGGSVSYTVGQMVYSTHMGTNANVSEGIQQPFEISVISGIERAEGISLTCKLYPNPVTDYIMLKIENYNMENLSYQIFNINGKLLDNKKITDRITHVSMQQFKPAAYILKLIDKDKEIKSFKIIKN